MKRLGAFVAVLLAGLLAAGCAPGSAATAVDTTATASATAQRTLGQIDAGPLDDDELITAIHLLAPDTFDVPDEEILRAMRNTCQKMNEGLSFADIRSVWEGTGVGASTIEDMHTAVWLGAHSFCPEYIAEIEAG